MFLTYHTVTQPRYQLFNNIFMVVSLVSCEPSNVLNTFQSVSARICLSTIMLGILILTKSYSGALISFLFVPLTQNPIESMSGMVQVVEQ